ncbi:zinc metalloprotease HtpX [Bryobacter aggregatus]|uniref:zinc metalloprotease HtpX n=1 Tax=Bryobacter aggregatus TaxID=360054 RepID=UPI0004E1BBB2|nr:zinc metalloprotease HtpX [Bryobacter aggregatus]
MNSVKTVLLLGGMSGFLLLMGETFGGRQGLMLALGGAVLMNFFSYFFSEKMALSMSGAQRVSDAEHPQIYARLAPMTERLTQKMGIPMPKLWVLPEESPNAFATGRNPEHASVAVSAGLLEVMNDSELEAVVAHELGHVKNRDILISSIAATLGAAITGLARFGMFFGGRRDDDGESRGSGGIFMLFLAPIAALLIQMAVSRTREYSADATSAKYTGSPTGLVNALRKLDSWSQRIPMEAAPSMSHMYIFPPLLGGLGRLFSTHPSTEQRIAALLGNR